MKKYVKMLSVLLLIFFVCSCASQPVPPPSEWRYEKEAIHLNFIADPQLNLYDGEAHTLLVCVYQLRDPNAFNQLTEDEDGLYKLLECSRFDSSVVSSQRLFVQPRQSFTDTLDRAEGARYVAVVAGYYVVQKEGMVRLFDVPWYVETKGLIRRTKMAKPGPLNIDLVLGSEQIQKFGG
jgi:type VI secretion system VasD/TssJ family lipoprotein